MIDMEVQWLEDFCSMTLRTTGSNVAAIEDYCSIGHSESRARRVSFNKVPVVFNYCKNTNINRNKVN